MHPRLEINDERIILTSSYLLFQILDEIFVSFPENLLLNT